MNGSASSPQKYDDNSLFQSISGVSAGFTLGQGLVLPTTVQSHQLLVSRITVHLRTSTHLDGFGVYQDFTCRSIPPTPFLDNEVCEPYVLARPQHYSEVILYTWSNRIAPG